MTYKLIGKASNKKFSKVNHQSITDMFPQKETLGFMEYQNTKTKLVIRLDEEIREVAYYADVIERMSNLTDEDQVHLILNTIGGDAHGAMAIISAIENTDADVIAVVEGRCHSAGSIILMHCDGAAIGKYAHALCHVWSNFDGGKAPDFDSSYNFNRNFLREFIEDSYKHFLTEVEIQQMLDGKDFWFSGDDLLERFGNRLEMLQRDYEQSQGATDEYEDEETCEGCKCGSSEPNEPCANCQHPPKPHWNGTISSKVTSAYDKEFYGDDPHN